MSTNDVDDGAVLVLRLRPARRRARGAAVAEVVALLRHLGARPAKGGPLSEQSGTAWVAIDDSRTCDVRDALRPLGYTREVLLVRPVNGDDRIDDVVGTVRWHRRDAALVRIWHEPDDALRDRAPDRRTFLLECGDGVVRPITGYRGSGGPLERRALPVVDARLLVNLVWSSGGGVLLDPFAGAGAVVVAAVSVGWKTLSMDIDHVLRFGLADFGARHMVADARALPLCDSSIDAVATEPPYHPEAVAVMPWAIGEMARVLRRGGRGALLVAEAHGDQLATEASLHGLALTLNEAIDRKGTPVRCIAFQRL